jgi:hypothetical protein
LAGAPATVQAQTATNAAPAATTPASTTAPAPAKKTEYKGEITALDATSVTIKNKKGTMTFAITADTKFEFKDGKTFTPATPADFAVGDKITGSYLKNADGTMTASSVHKKKPVAK